MFRSLEAYNYRLWAAGALVSNVGTWMQRTAQDWIVLTQLTNHDAAAVGVTMSLQFGPQLLLLPLSGTVADRFNQRTILKVTQASMGLLSLVLGLLTVTGSIQLWHVYVLAFLLGCTQAFDSPARQTFVSQLVGGPNLSNAVALNSASFNTARTIGPAVAGVLIAIVGSGWIFLINFASFGAVLGSLFLLRASELLPAPRAKAGKGNMAGGLRYVRTRPDIMIILLIMFIYGTFGVNFPIYIATMATVVFNSGATGFGVLSSIIAIGSITGALLSARRDRPRLRFMFLGTALFGGVGVLAALAPSYWLFAVTLIFMGLAAQTITTTANSYVQLTTPSAVRGRVMALFMAIFTGGTPIGAPLIGWVANEFGPRWALGVGAAAGIVATVIGVAWLVKYRNLRVRYIGRKLQLSYIGDARERAAEEMITEEITVIKGG